MKRFTLAATAFALSHWPVPAHAQSAQGVADGTLLSAEPCPPNQTTDYEAYFERVKAGIEWDSEAAKRENLVRPAIDDDSLRAALPSPDEFAERVAYEGFECLDIRYASDGLSIAGYLWKPVETEGRSLPLIIWNRGGNRDFGSNSPWSGGGRYDLLKAGYVVMASQYREGPGSEGTEQFGGDDVDDIRALVPLAHSLGYVDTNNMFLFGGSRGGMMTYLVTRGENPFRAAAVLGGIADLDRSRVERPVFNRLWPQLIPDWEGDGTAALERRSAARWADEITTPMILFHGSDDWRVNPQDAIDVANGMRKAGVPVELHLYYGDTHGVTLNYRDMTEHMLRFFERFKNDQEAKSDD